MNSFDAPPVHALKVEVTVLFAIVPAQEALPIAGEKRVRSQAGATAAAAEIAPLAVAGTCSVSLSALFTLLKAASIAVRGVSAPPPLALSVGSRGLGAQPAIQRPNRHVNAGKFLIYENYLWRDGRMQ